MEKLAFKQACHERSAKRLDNAMNEIRGALGVMNLMYRTVNSLASGPSRDIPPGVIKSVSVSALAALNTFALFTAVMIFPLNVDGTGKCLEALFQVSGVLKSAARACLPVLV